MLFARCTAPEKALHLIKGMDHDNCYREEHFLKVLHKVREVIRSGDWQRGQASQGEPPLIPLRIVPWHRYQIGKRYEMMDYLPPVSPADLILGDDAPSLSPVLSFRSRRSTTAGLSRQSLAPRLTAGREPTPPRSPSVSPYSLSSSMSSSFASSQSPGIPEERASFTPSPSPGASGASFRMQTSWEMRCNPQLVPDHLLLTSRSRSPLQTPGKPTPEVQPRGIGPGLMCSVGWGGEAPKAKWSSAQRIKAHRSRSRSNERQPARSPVAAA